MTALAQDIASSKSVQRLNTAPDRLFAWLDARLAGTVPWSLAVALLFGLQLLLIFGHRPWLDEWQALQLALQSPTLADLLDNLHYEGHPPLWYLLLRTVGAVVGPYAVLPVAAAMLAVVAQAMLLFASPFSRAERLSLATGCFMLFEFMTLSRGLTLGVTLTVVAMAARRSRWMWLALALMPMCDFLFGVLSAILLTLAWRDRRWWWPGAAAWLASAALAAWTVRPAPDIVPALDHHGLVGDTLDYLARTGLLLLPLQWGARGPTWNGVPPFGVGAVLGLIFFLFASTQWRGDRLSQALFWGFVGLSFAFTLAVYPLPARYLMLIALLLILLVWRRAESGIAPTAGFRAWLIAGSCCGLFVAGWNLAVPFDTEDAAVREIARRGLTDRHWMVFPESRAQGISALTGMTFERTEQRCMQTFIRWNFRTRIDTAAQLADYLRRETASLGRFYLLSDLPLSDTLPRDLVRPLAHVAPGYDGFGYHLFVVGPDLPSRPQALPLCVPNQRPL